MEKSPNHYGIDVFTINDIADEIIHEIAKRVQYKMGIKTGDGGGQFFSDDQHRIDIAQIVGDYADFEGAIRKNAKG